MIGALDALWHALVVLVDDDEAFLARGAPARRARVAVFLARVTACAKAFAAALLFAHLTIAGPGLLSRN